MDSWRILERLYGVTPPRRRFDPLRGLRRAARAWVRRYNWRLVIGALVAGLWMVGHIYYYNTLIDLEFNVQAAWAQVEATQEKRNHIQRNLRRILRYYAGYESGLMSELTEIRTRRAPRGAEPTPTGEEDLDAMLGRLQIIAENYPSLRLNGTAERFTEAVIGSETEITKNIHSYNVAVNAYTTMLSQFPGAMFGKVLGFEQYEFYSPPDRETLPYREVDL